MMDGFGRDEMCRNDVSRMAELGKFGEEFTFYIFTYSHLGRRKYCISEYPEQIYNYRQQCLLAGIYPTFIERSSQRYMIPTGRREGIKQQARIQLAKQVQEKYPKWYLNLLESYGILEPNNTAYELLKEMQGHWNGFFDANHLQLYNDLIEQAFLSKCLNPQSYEQLRQWSRKMSEQSGLFDEPAHSQIRFFSAFLYEDESGRMALEQGLFKYKMVASKEKYELAGKLTTPIFTKAYWFEDIRHRFESEAHEYLLGDYLDAVKALKKLPSVLNHREFREKIDIIQHVGDPKLVQLLGWFGNLWNLS